MRYMYGYVALRPSTPEFSLFVPPSSHLSPYSSSWPIRVLPYPQPFVIQVHTLRSAEFLSPPTLFSMLNNAFISHCKTTAVHFQTLIMTSKDKILEFQISKMK